MKAHVICCNDSVEHVVFGTEDEAKLGLEELKGEHFKRFLQAYGDRPQTHEEYRRHYWHIHTVHASFRPGLVKPEELSKLRMVAGNEKRISRVIDMGAVKCWVGFGWVDEGAATDADQMIYPTVDRS